MKVTTINTMKIAEAIKNYLVDLAIDINDISAHALEDVIKKTLPSERELMIERASHYLFVGDLDGDLSTEEMCDAIAKHEDQYDIIDNVEGVVVWEKVEGNFNCDDFLSEIGYVSK